MKDYPRIYNICTVGLIHHHDFEYRIHSFRTDFVGDSGCGKSMIADFLQLTFVGVGSFKSATIGTGERNAETMVLESSGNSNDFGYVFLNVEVKQNQYLTVGTYLERSGSGSCSFLVQAGYNWDEESDLIYSDNSFSKELVFDEEGNLLPIDELSPILEDKGLYLEKWKRLKTFHKILFNNEILPIDLSVSKDTLTDYKKIIQSFSRRTLDTSKSESLKNFLFGKDEHRRIEAAYHTAIKELETDVQAYGNNLEEIEIVTNKGIDLGELMTAKIEMNRAHESYVIARLAFYKNKKSDEAEKICKKVVSHKTSQTLLEKLQKKAEIDKNNADKNTEGLKLAEEEALDSYTKANAKSQKLKEAKGILSILGSEEGILERFSDYHNRLKHKSNLQTFSQLMESKRLWNLFETINWNNGYSSGLSEIQNSINQLDETLKRQNALKAYNDLSNKDSLAYWAVDQKRAFSLIEESVLVHFAKEDIKIVKPQNEYKRFLPKPGKLFENLTTVEEDEQGFWLSLDGVNEYVSYVPEQLLETADSEIISEQFQKQEKDIEEKIQQTQKSKKELNQLLTELNNCSNVAEKVKSYTLQSELVDFKEHPNLNLSEGEFKDVITTLGNEEEITNALEINKKKYDKAKQNATDNKQIIEDLSEALDELGTIDFDSIIDSKLLQLVDEDVIRDGHEAYELPSTSRKLRQEVQRLKPNIITYHLQLEFIKQLDELTTGLENAKSDAELYSIEIPASIELIDETELFKSKSNFEKAEINYQNLFKQKVRTHLSENEQTKFVENYDYLDLCYAILPKSFAKLEFTEETVISQIDNHLKQIARKNQDLNERKFLKIRDLIEDVNSEISSRLDKIRRIKNLFSNESSEITGGHFVKLEESFNSAFPRTWLSKFAEEFETKSGLFGSEDSLYQRVAKKVGVEEKLIEAFHASGGAQNVVPTASQLLDPNSYFDLEFYMQTKSGRVNDGSAGQTYAAIALFCIARLSLLNPDEKSRKKGLRFMPIDEAETIGSNYNMLMKIADINDYQIFPLSIRPLPNLEEGKQNMYILNKNPDTEEKINLTPTAILGEE